MFTELLSGFRARGETPTLDFIEVEAGILRQITAGLDHVLDRLEGSVGVNSCIIRTRSPSSFSAAFIRAALQQRRSQSLCAVSHCPNRSARAERLELMLGLR